MYKHILLLVAGSLIVGCSGKEEALSVKEKSNLEQLFTQDVIYQDALVNTQKAHFIASFETKALLVATYLNPVFEMRNNQERFQNKMEDAEYFFVGVYLPESEKHEFNTQGYSLTLNGTQPTEVKLLDKNDPLLSEMPMVDNWSTYYQVKFKNIEENDFSLIFENDRFGKDTLEYSKGKKPLFDSLRGLSTQHNL